MQFTIERTINGNEYSTETHINGADNVRIDPSSQYNKRENKHYGAIIEIGNIVVFIEFDEPIDDIVSREVS